MNKPEDLISHFRYWEKTKDIVDNLMDVMLNYRQSGHPGGSRSKMHAFLTTLLSGAMRWDIRYPEKRFADRFVLGAGHTVPMVYCTLAVLNEALNLAYEKTKDKRFWNPQKPERILLWEDLLKFRRRGGLSGHAEFAGKTLFLKFNTGPSGHGSPAAAGIALALKRAGVDAKVFIMEGEGGLTPGATHETANSAWGLALDNLHYLVDWNDFGIDDHSISAVVYGTPKDWFGSHGFQVFGTEQGSDWESLSKTFHEMLTAPNPNRAPHVLWFKTRKGRGYGKYDYASHGVPHPLNSEAFWESKKPFAEKYSVQFKNFGEPAPEDPSELAKEFRANLEAVITVLKEDPDLYLYLAERLIELGESVPSEAKGFRLGVKGKDRTPFADPRIFDVKNYPADLFVAPGTHAANRAALAKWGAWINAFGWKEYGRPLFLVSSADLSGSTNISGFASGYGDFKGYGYYERVGTPEGVLLPQEITEFANAGILTGIASVNLSENPEKEFDGFWGATSTYGSFSYLLYGPFRLFSQLAQDCDLKTGKIIFVAGHSGPETADDSRTHFGIFSPGVTQLFPQGHIINLYPWEYNEVPVVLAAALKEAAPLIALHLTRPNVEIPDRDKIGMASHFEAARGAYLMRDFKSDQPKGGVLIVQGTSAVANTIKVLPELDKKRLNVKIVVAVSPELFARQSEEYRNRILSIQDQMDSTVVTTSARWLMHPWLFNKVAERYALSSDWDNRWRTGGTVEEVLEEAHLSPSYILEGIERFVKEREKRLGELRDSVKK
jgi:transketolase